MMTMEASAQLEGRKNSLVVVVLFGLVATVVSLGGAGGWTALGDTIGRGETKGRELKVSWMGQPGGQVYWMGRLELHIRKTLGSNPPALINLDLHQ